MKAVISKVELTSLISKIQSIIATKPSVPVAANVLIEAVDDQLILSGTDLTTSMRCYADAKVIEEGAIALPARRFFHLVRELTAPQIKITSDSAESATILAGSSHFKIKGISKNEFPTIPDIENATQIPIQSSHLKDILSKTGFSVGKDDSRQYLNGILLQVNNRQGFFIGTDGKRLSKITTQLDDIDPSFQGSYIIPIKAVDEMNKMLEDSKNYALLGLTGDKVFLEYENLVLTTKLLIGQYPDVNSVIPKNINHQLILHREELISLLRQMCIFTAETGTSIRFIFETGQLNLLAYNKDIGEGNVNMPVNYQGDRLEIAFNPYFFLDILRHSKDETVQFLLNDPYNPGMITDSTKAIFVIMPMRLEDQSNSLKNAPEDTVLT